MRFSFMTGGKRPAQKIGKRIAIIGSGPSGLAATGYLASKGYDITVYERLPIPGGIMVFGIPEARIPRERIIGGCKELEEVYSVKFRTSTKVSANGDQLLGDNLVKDAIELQSVVEDNDATIIATGTWNSRGLPAENATYRGIHSALEYLFRCKANEIGLIPKKERIKLGNNVAVIGSGLVAVDAAIEAVTEGHNVRLISIEHQFDSPSGSYEIGRIKKMGVEHIERTVIKRVLGDGKVESIETIKVNAEVKAGVILKLEQISGTEQIIEKVDNIIVGIGQIPTPPFNKDYKDIKTLRWGGIEINDRYLSSKAKVFATGDITTGITKVGRAYQTGLKTAHWVNRYLQG
jgi:glutamate synthase (NADPH/NADH) small chain